MKYDNKLSTGEIFQNFWTLQLQLTSHDHNNWVDCNQQTFQPFYTSIFLINNAINRYVLHVAQSYVLKISRKLNKTKFTIFFELIKLQESRSTELKFNRNRFH